MRDNVLLEMLRKRRGTIIVCFIFLLLAFALWWFYGHGRLVLNNVDPSKQATYYITSNGSGETSTHKVNDGSVTKVLKSGQYQVLVKQGDKSYWSVVKVGHFLMSQSVEPDMQAERSRTFIGNNPASCTQVVNGVLASYTCGGNADTVKVHLPSTNQIPTYTKTPTNGFTSRVEGIVTTPSGPIYISRQLEAAGLSSSHLAIRPSQAVDIANQNITPISLKGLDSDRNYTAVPFDNGFVMYDATFQYIRYFPDPNAQPLAISMPGGKKADIPIRFDSDGHTLLAAYSNSVGDTSESTPNPNTELALYSDGKTKQFNLPDTFQATLVCGKVYICAIDGKKLIIYDTSGKKLKQLYEIPDVKIMSRFGSDNILFLKDRDVISFNVEKGTGYVAYSLGNYQLNALSDSGSGSILNLINTKGTGVALLLSNEATDSFIDKQVDTLLHSKNVSDLSAYQNYLFVSPNLGQLVYIPSDRMYAYPADRKQSVNNAINQEFKDAGVDVTKYIIVNPYAK